MAQYTDGAIASAIERVREAFNSLPHEEAMKLEEPLEQLFAEVFWLQHQRDEARSLIPGLPPQGYWILLSPDERGGNAQPFGSIALGYEESIPRAMESIKTIVAELNEELHTKFAVRVFKHSYSHQSELVVDGPDELKRELSNVMKELQERSASQRGKPPTTDGDLESKVV